MEPVPGHCPVTGREPSTFRPDEFYRFTGQIIPHFVVRCVRILRGPDGPANQP